jgi:hypothetical protein
MNQTLPDVLKADPEIAEALEKQSRARRAMLAAENEERVAEGELRHVPTANAFDEAAAADRVERAKAHDAIYGTTTVAETENVISAERKACRKACEAADAACSAAKAKAAAAARAKRAAESVFHDSNSVLFMLVQDRAGSMLETLSAETVTKASELFQLVKTIRAVAQARDGSSNRPKAYVEVALPYPEGGALGLERLGGRTGSTRSQAAIVFEER